MSRKKLLKSAKASEFIRPPVVTIMGHVDHGKTTLLDYLRKSNICAREAGGITQHIGAYRVIINSKEAVSAKASTFVKTSADKLANQRWITLIDTPGHEAFGKMRERGAQVTDLAVLVVSAVDGVMPQTLESIAYIKAAKIPFIVAINKIDLEEANIEKVKKQLVKKNVLVEGYGGEIVCVPISAKTGKGVNELLEMISLVSEMSPEKFKADPKGKLEAYVIESKMDKRCGILASILVKNGTLKIGEEILIEKIKGKIKAMRDEFGRNMTEAGPSVPVEIMGIEKLPVVGSRVERKSGRPVRQKHKDDEGTKVEQALPSPDLPSTPEGQVQVKEETSNKLKIILKADVAGSLEALIYCLPKEIEIFEKGVGEITESDVLLAKIVGAVILGFNVSANKQVEKLAETENILIKSYKIIYQLIEEIGDVIKELNKPKPTEKILGKAKIIAQFQGSTGQIAGCKILEGRLTKSDSLRLERDKKVLGDNLKIISLKQAKKEMDKVVMGMECGVMLSPEIDFRVGDMVISYRKLV